MLKLRTRHLLTGEELSRDEIEGLLDFALELKKERAYGNPKPLLQNRHLALIFEKPSLRTRMSFTVAMHELGGHIVESTSSNSKKEEPEDLVRVIAGYCHAVMVRTHEHQNLDRMVTKSPIPVINGLSDLYHPCQALSDLLTLKEVFSDVLGLQMTYVGDGNNVLHSLLLLLPYLGVHLRFACPPGYGPNALILKTASKRAQESGGSITAFDSPREAVRGSHAIYTDVWTSMGFESEKQERARAFSGYQVSEALLAHAAPNAIILHCLPMVRGEEISDSLPDQSNSEIFRQSENRLHMQKAILAGLIR